jgi:hypothetical protein
MAGEGASARLTTTPTLEADELAAGEVSSPARGTARRQDGAEAFVKKGASYPCTLIIPIRGSG